jgi:chromosome segregation ATPase
VHVLTKIFIVLVSLLAVLLVPLIVVYAYNENNYKARYQQAAAQAAEARANLAAAESRNLAVESRQAAEIERVRQSLRDADRRRDEALAEARRLESQLVDARAGAAEINARLSELAAGGTTGAALTTSLVEELRTLRSDALAAERQNVELDEALRDVTSQLEVAIAARRALQEELQRVTEERAELMGRVGEYVARFGALTDEPVAARAVPDRTLTTTVLSVRRTTDQTLVEIAAGSRDGVREGWTMTIGRGSKFLGNVRIINVDINRSTGIVLLEDASRGLVDVGDIVQTWAGVD